MTSVETLIIGAGPAGLQLGYFLEKGGHSYKIVERAAAAGSFYEVHPLSGFLTGAAARPALAAAGLKADVNSLLTLSGEWESFGEISKDYHPDRADFALYLNNFARKYALKVEYGTEAVKIRKGQKEDVYQVDLRQERGAPLETLTCRRVVVATGLAGGQDERGIVVEGISGAERGEGGPHGEQELGGAATGAATLSKPEDFTVGGPGLAAAAGKRVLILGSGPAAAEVAEVLTPVAGQVVVHEFLGRGATSSAEDFQTLLRAAPTFRAACESGLTAATSFSATEKLFIIAGAVAAGESPKYTLATVCSAECATRHPLPVAGSAEGFDLVVLATGPRLDTGLFDFPLALNPDQKYPLLRWTYEAKDHRNLFFIGRLMQGLAPATNASALGQLHGYRHLIEFMYRALFEKKLEARRFPVASIDKLLHHILYRINVAPELFHLGGQLSDIFYYDKEAKEIVYFESISPWIIFVDSFKVAASAYLGVLSVEGPASGAGANSGHGRYPRLKIFKDVPQRGKQLLEDFALESNPLSEFTDRELYYNKFVRIMRMIIH
jgi:hypothetical protein